MSLNGMQPYEFPSRGMNDCLLPSGLLKTSLSPQGCSPSCLVCRFWHHGIYTQYSTEQAFSIGHGAKGWKVTYEIMAVRPLRNVSFNFPSENLRI